MAMVIRSTKELVDPAKLKLKILVYGLPGSGKTTFLGSVPDIRIAACETGSGKGLMSVASRGIPFVEPKAYADFDELCSGLTFKDDKPIGLDSLSDMTKTFIKDYALGFPRQKGDTLKRKAGVPELDDYQVMAEVTRRLLRKLLDQDKHIVVTSTLKIDKPDPESGQGEMLICPDLPGALSLGSSAMFDMVLCFRTRVMMAKAGDPKSKFVQHYIVTKGNQNLVAKNRYNHELGQPIFADEEIFDKEKELGTFPYFLKKIQAAFTESAAAPAVAA